MTRLNIGLVCVVVMALTTACGEKEAPETQAAGPSAAKGGLLYDKFWKVSSADEPADTHPLWAKRTDTESNKRTGSTTWRCKECHGWDYKGVDGAYAAGSHKTGFGGVLGSKLTQAELVTSLADAHGYRAAGLSDTDLESLALFVREGLVDTAAWIDENGVFKGDAKRGKILYMNGLGKNKACAKCHGSDGLALPIPSNKTYEDFVGKIATKNPWEFLHKVRFGQPGTKMPAAAHGGASMQDILDLSAYAQTLPTSK